VTEVTLVPEDLGVSRRSLDQIRGADAAFNAAVATRLLDGEVSAVRDAVLLNAGVALAVAAGDEGPGTDGVSDAVRRGMAAAAGAIDSGAARQALARWIAATRSVAG
jgi:anthranilate phosphoribosyltransferase